MNPILLIVDDDTGHLAMLQTLLKSWGYNVEAANDGREALAKCKIRAFDLVLMDIRMAQMGGIEALKLIKDYNPAIPILIMTAYSSVDSAVEALKAGAYDYLTKPLDMDMLRLSIERALDHIRLKSENAALRNRLPSGFDLANIVGKSDAVRKLLEQVAMVAPTEATVLITGESGTGKELVAKAIHFNSLRKDGPLVTINCAALTENLLESELFGHERGAFTGAERRREGRFMQANNGTIFLDEIGEISSAMQAKLLRVIQEREIQRVGSDKLIGVNVRILAATNRNLKMEVEEHRFREDLFYRLNVMVLEVPPLRIRREDIPLLAQHFVAKYADKNRKSIKGFTPDAMDCLVKYDWPGNVRELENAMERAVILATGEYIETKDLPLSIFPYCGAEISILNNNLGELPGQSLREVEKQAIITTLSKTNWNKAKAAQILGVTRATLHKKINQYNLVSRRCHE